MFLKPKFKDKEISWCPLCEIYIVSCEKCSGTSCNCKCCDECKNDQDEFVKLHPWPEYWMSEDERKVIEKYKRIKHLLEECLSDGRGLDLEWLYYNGKFCGRDWEILDLKFEPYETACEKTPEKFTFLKK